VLLDENDAKPGCEFGEAFGDLLDDSDPHALRRLVEQEKLWAPEQGPADGQHLPLAARQGVGGLPQALAELRKDVQHLADLRLLALADAAEEKVLTNAKCCSGSRSMRRRRAPRHCSDGTARRDLTEDHAKNSGVS
jgi:hypothetical protein